MTARAKVDGSGTAGDSSAAEGSAAPLPAPRSGERIEAEDLAFILSPTAASSSAIDSGLNLSDATGQFQEQYIRQSIERARGNVSQAAKILGLLRLCHCRKMRQLGMATDEEGSGDRGQGAGTD